MIAMWHEPRFFSVAVPDVTMPGNLQASSDPTMDDMWQILQNAGVDVVLNGHWHDYERFPRLSLPPGRTTVPASPTPTACGSSSWGRAAARSTSSSTAAPGRPDRAIDDRTREVRIEHDYGVLQASTSTRPATTGSSSTPVPARTQPARSSTRHRHLRRRHDAADHDDHGRPPRPRRPPAAADHARPPRCRGGAVGLLDGRRRRQGLPLRRRRGPWATPRPSAGAETVDIEPTPARDGYWVVDSAGTVNARGNAPPLGSVAAGTLWAGEKVTSLSATPTGKGYWVFTTRGGS